MRISEERFAGLRRRARHICAPARAAGFVACLALGLGQARGVLRAPAQANSVVANSAAASAAAGIFAPGSAPGYIAVALMALALGVLVTLLCYRLRRRMGDKRDDRENR